MISQASQEQAMINDGCSRLLMIGWRRAGVPARYLELNDGIAVNLPFVGFLRMARVQWPEMLVS